MALNNLGLGFKITAEDGATSVFKKVENQIDKTGGAAKRAEADMEKVGGQLESIGQKMMMAGLAGVAGLSFAAKQAASFGAAITEVSTLVDTAKFSVADMRKITLGMSADFGQDVMTEVKGLYQAISAGAGDAKSATDLLTAANKLSIGGVTDVKTAVDGLTNVLNAYSLSYDNATKVSDAFFIALKNGKTTAAELGSTVGGLAPTAVAVGVSYEQMLASISAITTKGLGTAEAVTGMKAALSGIIKPTSEATAEAARLGITFDQATLRAKGFPAFLDSITKSSKFNKDSMSKLFSSVEGLNAILAITANGSATFNDILGQMGTRAGATDGAVQKMMNSPAFQGMRFLALAKNAMILTGEALLPLGMALLTVLNAGLALYNKMPAGLRTVLVGAFAAASGLLVFVGAIAAAAGAIAGLIAIGEPLLIALAAIATLIGAMVPPLAFLAVAAAVTAAAFDSNLGGIADSAKAVYKDVTLVWDGLEQLFTSGRLSGAVREELNAVGNDGLKDAVITLFQWGSAVSNFFTSIGTGFSGVFATLGPLFAGIKENLGEVASAFNFATPAGERSSKMFDTLGRIGAVIGDAIGTVVKWLVTGVSYVSSFAAGMVGGFTKVNAASASLGSSWATLVNSVMLIVSAFEQSSGSSISLQSIMYGLGYAVGIVAQVVATAVSIIVGAWMFVAAVVTPIITSLIGIFDGLGQMWSGVVNVITGLLTGNTSQAVKGFKQLVVGEFSAIISFLGVFLGIVAGIIDRIGAMFGKDLGNGRLAGKFIAGMKDDLANAVGLEKPTAAPASGGAPKPFNLVPSGPPGAGAPGAAPPGPGTAPGVAAAGGGGAAPPIVIPPPPPAPININHTTTLNVDGAAMAEVVERHQSASGARGFGPTSKAT